VKSIIEIQNRRSNYNDILEHRKDGQNVYALVGHSRNMVNLGLKKSNGDAAAKTISISNNRGTVLKTIPCSNLFVRKQAVLRIHKENLRIVRKLEEMKAH